MPTFYNIHLECNEWLQKFNQEFESLKIDENELDPFKDGYGDLMDNSELSEDYTDIVNQKPKNTFGQHPANMCCLNFYIGCLICQISSKLSKKATVD